MARRIQINENELINIIKEAAIETMGDMEKQKVYSTLLNTLNRADFYYEMSDAYNQRPDIRFHEDQDFYFSIIKNSQLTDEEKEDFINLWNMKKKNSTAVISRNSEAIKETEANYNEIYNKIAGYTLRQK